MEHLQNKSSNSLTWILTSEAGVYQHHLDNSRFKLEVKVRLSGKRVARRRVVRDSSLREAVRAREALLSEVNAEFAARPTPCSSTGTVANYAKLWMRLKAPRLRRSVADRYIDTLARWVLPALGEVGVGELAKRHVDTWVVWMEEQRHVVRGESVPYSTDTLLGAWRVGTSMLRDLAVEFDLPDRTRRVTPPSTGRRGVTESRTLTADELRRLLSEADAAYPQWTTLVHVLAYTGCRPGEALALRVMDYAVDEQVLFVCRSVSPRGDVTATKTSAAREVAVASDLARRLDQQVALRKGEGAQVEDLLFPSAKGGPRHSSSIAKVLRTCAERAGIEVRVGAKTLRRTANTLAVLSGVSGTALRDSLGHSDEKMTARYFGSTRSSRRVLSQTLEAVITGTAKAEGVTGVTGAGYCGGTGSQVRENTAAKG